MAGGRLIRNLYQRMKLVCARVVCINGDGTPKDAGRLYNSSVHYFTASK
jgi:hypothetical protein